MPLHVNIGTKDSEQLAQQLKSESHGQHPLIAWRHGEIPTLLRALGASQEKLLPNAQWPDEIFD
jgi:hypothetical protein